MANILKAVKWMREGKRVKCGEWVDPPYIRYDKRKCEIVDEKGKIVTWIRIFQLEAKDWRIVKKMKGGNK